MNGTVENGSEQATERKLVDSVWWTLRMSFGLVPLLAGLDKFFNLMTHWPKYVAPALAHALPVTPQHFMYGVGVIEIVAGLAVLLSPWTKLFAYVVAAWLAGIALNLIAGGLLRHRRARSRHGGVGDLAGPADRPRARPVRRAAGRTRGRRRLRLIELDAGVRTAAPPWRRCAECGLQLE